MPEENVTPTTDETVVETPVTEEVVEGSQPQEVDVDKSDNISQLRGYAKSLKDDVKTYKPSHEFIENKFGSVANAELAANFYGGFAGDEFDPDKFLDVISQLSPSRAAQLTEKLSKQEAQKLAKAELEGLFGGTVTNEEVKLFKQWKASGYNLGEGDDIPEALKLDSDGNPKSEEEINFLRDLQRQVKEASNFNKEKEATEAQEREYAAQVKIRENIDSFSNDRLKVLDKEFDAMGLKYAENDTADQRQEKDFIKSFIMDGIAGAFMKNVDASKDYQSAINHITSGEELLARRFEPRIEAKLIEIFRSKAVGKMLKSLIEAPTDEEVRPEINSSGTSTTDSTPNTGRVSANDIFDTLVQQGKIKL